MTKLSGTATNGSNFNTTIQQAANTLQQNGILLCPTDTIWGLSVLPDDEKAVQKLRNLKGRSVDKPFILLVPDKILLQKITGPLPDQIIEIAVNSPRPTSIVYDVKTGMNNLLISNDGTVCIRLVKAGFCFELMKYLNAPLVSTSANFAGKPSPQKFEDIEPEIIKQADWVVPLIYEPETTGTPSRILRFCKDGNLEVIRS